MVEKMIKMKKMQETAKNLTLNNVGIISKRDSNSFSPKSKDTKLQ